jgi:hypothetical protein
LKDMKFSKAYYEIHIDRLIADFTGLWLQTGVEIVQSV